MKFVGENPHNPEVQEHGDLEHNCAAEATKMADDSCVLPQNNVSALV